MVANPSKSKLNSYKMFNKENLALWSMNYMYKFNIIKKRDMLFKKESMLLMPL